MNKINFVDYPSTTTPLSANNLNTMQTYIENEFTSMQSEFSADIGTNTTDIQTNTNKINNLSTYSTSEVNTGMKWTNNKPLYRKVISFTVSTAATGWKSYSHGISNIDLNTAHIVTAWVKGSTSNGGNETVPNPSFQIGINSSNIRYINKTSDSGFDSKTCYVIVEYTKTTD